MLKDMLQKDGTNPFNIIFKTWPKMLAVLQEILEEDRRACKDIIKTLDAAGGEISAIFITIHFGYVCTEILVHYQVPIIAISPPGLAPHLVGYLGNPDNPADRPDIFLPMIEPLNFRERLVSTLVYGLLDPQINYFYLMMMERIMLDVKVWGQIIRERLDLLLLASHHVTHSASVLAPNTIEVGGIHCRAGLPLPPHLQQILDSHPEGVVYVSFGSSVRPSEMGEEKMAVFLKTFAQLSYTVIWKWDGEVMADLPSNVILQSWVPQQNLLAHPHLKVFVTHGGLLSLQESLYHATPIVGIPLGNDQKPNMMRAERRGYAVMLDWPTLNTRDLLAAIIKAATDPETRDRMDTAHSLFLDQKETSQSRAVWWIEYTIRHGGAQFLRPGCLSLAWYEYHLIDVIALILTAGLLSSLALLLCCVKLSKCCTTVTTGKPKTD